MTIKRLIELPDQGNLTTQMDGPEGAPVVVLSNSVLTDLSIWDAQVSVLSKTHRVLRYDQRGHGASDATPGPMSFDAYGADLLAILDAWDVSECTYVGLSMGVPTGLAALAADPSRFTGFVAVDGIAKSGEARVAFWTERRDTARDTGMQIIAEQTADRWLPGGSADQITALQEMIVATPVEGFASATHALQTYDQSSALAKITCPFLSITGENDGPMPQAVRTQFASVDHAQFEVIPDAGHVPNFQQPSAFNAVLTQFLTTIPTEHS